MCSQKQHFEGVGEVGLGRERRGPEMQRAEEHGFFSAWVKVIFKRGEE